MSKNSDTINLENLSLPSPNVATWDDQLIEIMGESYWEAEWTENKIRGGITPHQAWSEIAEHAREFYRVIARRCLKDMAERGYTVRAAD